MPGGLLPVVMAGPKNSGYLCSIPYPAVECSRSGPWAVTESIVKSVLLSKAANRMGQSATEQVEQ